MGLRVAELKKLGAVLEKYRDQVTFFIDLEAKIQDILDMGATGDHLGRLSYGQDVFNAIYNSLTVSQHLNLVALPGDKLNRSKEKLSEFREAANMLDKTRVDTGEKKRVGSGSGKGSVSSGAGSGAGPGVEAIPLYRLLLQP